MLHSFENDLIYSLAPAPIKKKMEDRILTQKDYLAELFRQQYFSVDTISADSIESLSYYINTFTELLKTRSKDLRKAQIDTLEAIVAHVKKGKFKGLIKLPTGSGKTRLFTEVVGALNMPSVVLIPRTSLKGQTMEGFVDLEVIDNKRVFLIGDKESKEKGAVAELKAALDTIERDHISNPIVLITYQSLLSIKRSDPELFDRFRKLTQCIIRDEAHRSLGDETADALEGLKSLDEGFDEGDKKLELLLTATPKLLGKDIRENYETIISIRTQEVIEEGDLILPRRKTVGKAYVTTHTENITEEFLKENSLKFVDDHGKPIWQKVIEAYEEEKAQQPNHYLPFVAVCSTIQQAEFIRGKMEERGHKAVRVTSGNKDYDQGVHEDDAKIMLLDNTTDGVSTVAKVAEGWDVKTLRTIMHFCPIRSEAKYIQVTGRIMRTLPEKEINYAVGMTPKSSENTIIIEPDVWYVGSVHFDEQGDGGSYDMSGAFAGMAPADLLTKVSGLGHFINSGEFDAGFLEQHYGSLDGYEDFKDLAEVNEHGRVIIDNSEYQWVGQTTPNEQLRGMSSWVAVNDIKSQSEERKKKYTRLAKLNRISVTVVEVNVLEELMKNKLEKQRIGDHGRVEIEGKVYQRVGHATPSTQLWGIQGFTAVSRVKKQNDAWKKLYVKDARSKKGMLTVVELKALEALLKEDGELLLIGENSKVSIEGVTYQWLGTTTPKQQLRGVSAAIALNRVNIQTAEWKKKHIKKARVATGIVQVVNEEELKKLVKHLGDLPTLNAKGRVSIEGKEYQWVGTRTPAEQLRGLNGAAAKLKIDQQSDKRKKIYVKEAKSIIKGTTSVVLVEELEKLIKNLGEIPSVDQKGRVMIDGVEYQRVGPTTPPEQLMGISGFIAHKKVIQQSEEWKMKYMKAAKSSGKPINVFVVEQFQELMKEDAKLLELGDNGRVTIEDVVYQRVGPTTPATQLRGMKGNAAQQRIHMQSEERKTAHMKKARFIAGICSVFEVSALEKVIKEEAQLPVLNDQGRVYIDEKQYMWAGPKTPKEKLRGINTSFVNKVLNEQTDAWRKSYMKIAKATTGVVKVFEMKILEELLKPYIGVPEIGEDDKVVIKDKIYLYISSRAASEKLWGMRGILAQKRVNSQPDEWKKLYVKKVFVGGNLTEAIDMTALEALLKEEAQLPSINEQGRVTIQGVEYQWVGEETPPHMLGGVSGKVLWRKIVKQGDAWIKMYVRPAKRGSRSIKVVEVKQLEKIKSQ